MDVHLGTLRALCETLLFPHGVYDIGIAIMIMNKRGPWVCNKGRSSYARKRRAKAIGRCHRCYRVNPKFYFTTRCNGRTCVPPLSHNTSVEIFIKEGVTEVIPSFEC